MKHGHGILHQVVEEEDLDLFPWKLAIERLQEERIAPDGQIVIEGDRFGFAIGQFGSDRRFEAGPIVQAIPAASDVVGEGSFHRITENHHDLGFRGELGDPRGRVGRLQIDGRDFAWQLIVGRVREKPQIFVSIGDRVAFHGDHRGGRRKVGHVWSREVIGRLRAGYEDFRMLGEGTVETGRTATTAAYQEERRFAGGFLHESGFLASTAE